MNREEIIDLFKRTYKQSVEDNKNDFTLIFSVISKLCFYLSNKNILNGNDVIDILNISKDLESEGEENE